MLLLVVDDGISTISSSVNDAPTNGLSSSDDTSLSLCTRFALNFLSPGLVLFSLLSKSVTTAAMVAVLMMANKKSTFLMQAGEQILMILVRRE